MTFEQPGMYCELCGVGLGACGPRFCTPECMNQHIYQLLYEAASLSTEWYDLREERGFELPLDFPPPPSEIWDTIHGTHR